MGTALQPVPPSTQSSTSPLLSRWPSRSARTTMRSARLWSTSRSTRRSTPAMSTSPCPLTSTRLTRRCQALLTYSGRLLIVSRTLQDLQTVAMEKKDFHLIDFIQRELLEKNVIVIKFIGDCLTKIKRAGDGPGLYIVDREME